MGLRLDGDGYVAVFDTNVASMFERANAQIMQALLQPVIQFARTQKSTCSWVPPQTLICAMVLMLWFIGSSSGVSKYACSRRKMLASNEGKTAHYLKRVAGDECIPWSFRSCTIGILECNAIPQDSDCPELRR